MLRAVDKVMCRTCHVHYGVIQEIESKDRPGFFVNRCIPDVLPKKCPVCNSVITRVTVDDEKYQPKEGLRL